MNNYRIYFTSRTINDIGDTLQEIAIIYIMALYTQSAIIAGIIISLNALVRIACSFLAIKTKTNSNVKILLRNMDLVYGGITLLFFFIYKINGSDMNYWVLIIYEVICSYIYTYYKIYQDVIIKDICSSNEQIARLFALDNIISVLVSLISSFLIILLKIEIFLLLNAFSFFISSIIISRLNIQNNTFKNKNIETKIFKKIVDFRYNYPFVFRIIITSSILSFFYATYNVVFQNALKIFSISANSIGILTGVYDVFVIILSYIVGFLRIKDTKKVICIFLLLVLIGLLITPFFQGVVFIVIITIVYSIIGGGYNSFCQIIFQNYVNAYDIPTLKGIYNIFCGISIMVSGYASPLLLRKVSLNFFCIIMAAVVVFLIIYNIIWNIINGGTRNDNE